MTTFGDDIDRMLEGQSKTYFDERGGGRDRDRRRRSRSRDRDRGAGRRRRAGYDQSRAEDRRRERQEKERERDQRTIFAAQIHPKNEEREIFEFFSEVGKVVDIQLIRDTRTLKSKGLAYVEFEDRRSVPHALALSGRNLNGYPVLVQMTQAERGIAAPPTLVSSNAGAEKQGTLFVKNINSKLSKEDIEPIFTAFGEVRSIQVSKGDDGLSEALVEFRRHAEAATAMTQLNGLEVVGYKFEIKFANEKAMGKLRDAGPGESRTARFEDESGNGGVVMSLQDKQSLMNNLAKRAGLAVPDQNPYAAIPTAKQEPVKRARITQCLLLTNMFDPSKETDPDFDLEIREDVREEVSAFGRLLHIYVDKGSSEGRIYLKFEDPEVATKAHKALDGRWFAQNRIVSTYMDPAEYGIQFPGV